MPERFRRLVCARGGNAAVEFALIAPLFLTMLLGMVDYGVAAFEKSQLEAAARAALQAVLEDSDADADDVESAAKKVAPGADVEVDEECECSDGTSIACNGTCTTGGVREWVTVTVADSIQLLVPWPGWDDPLPLEGKARARVR